MILTNGSRGGFIKYLIYSGLIILFAGHSTICLSQVDTEFWFVVPELSHRGNTGGTPGTLRIATLELPATVTISMPANPYNAVSNPNGFQDIVVNMAANSTAAVDLSHLIDVALNPLNNRLENKPLTPSGINNFGLHITATNMITAYWEVNYDLGADLWTLKGRNALGTLFYTPFQTDYNNRFLTPRAYSSIDIVATEDNTLVTFTLPAGKAASYGSTLTGILPGGTYTVTLNKGQTFSLFPYNYSVLAADRLAGTRIASTNPIAVTLKDDAIQTSNLWGQDVIGDQIVPVNIVGNNYIVPETGNPTYVYVVATQDNTNIYAYNKLGQSVGLIPTLDRGEQARIIIPNGSEYVHITSGLNPTDPVKPFYTFQLGAENVSRGGALVPAIGCTGNTQLAFTRARTDNKFYFFIIVSKGNEDNFLIDGQRDDGIIDPGGFEEIVGTGYMAWFSNSINSNILTVGQHLVENTGDIFHLGILNGFPASGAQGGRLYYGYYSDFGGLNIGASVAGTNSTTVRACYGDPVQLYAYGGTNYHWTPDTYLDDATSNLPVAIDLPPGPHKYTVEVSGACATGTRDLTVDVSDPVSAFFQTNVSSGCSPLSVYFDDQSTGATSWQYDFGDGTPLIRYDDDVRTPYPEPPDPITFTRIYTNTTNLADTITVTLLVKNGSGCADIFTKTIVVFPEIHAEFSVPPDSTMGCDPLPVKFHNNSTGNTDTWFWEFGDGGSSIEENPQHTFRNLFGPDALTFETRLIAISPYYCRDTSTLNIIVFPYIEANFVFDTVFACTPHEIIITDQSFGADLYFWDFGDGSPISTSTGPKISKTYENNSDVPDTLTIRLRVENNEGCFDIIERDVIVFPEIDASFTASPVEGCSPFAVEFFNYSSGAAAYFWDFGDGGTSSEELPVHLYDRNLMDHDTTYTVTLVATSAEFCSDTMRMDILVHPYIEAAFTVNDIVGCDPFTISINNQSISVDTYLWDFGDKQVSNTSEAVFEHLYLNPGNSAVVYPLRLIVLNEEGCSDTLVRNITVHPFITADFTATAFEGCHPLTVKFTPGSENAANYLWNFGDGGSAVQKSPEHTFNNFGTSDTTYMVTLTTSTADGVCVKSISWPIIVHPQAKAEFTFSKALGCNPFEVTFENISTGGSYYIWNFGDGKDTITTDLNPVTHVFSNSGFVNNASFNVSLTAVLPVVLADGSHAECSNQITKTVAVYPAVDAAFTMSVNEGCHPLEVVFLNSSQGGLTYLWDFGDGSSTSALSPRHIFTNFTDDVIKRQVKLTATSRFNCVSEFTDTITIHPTPRSGFETDKIVDCPPFNVLLSNTSINADHYTWIFDDGNILNTDSENPINHIYDNTTDNIVTYRIKLIARSDYGCGDSIQQNLNVYPGTVADFNTNTEACSPLTSYFTNESILGESFKWDFGDGSATTVKDPTHMYFNFSPRDTNYVVTLTSTSKYGCTDSIKDTLYVYPQPKAEFTPLPSHQTFPASTVSLTNLTSAGTWSYLWNMGDGFTSNVENPAPHSYSDWGEYDIKLYVSSSHCNDSVSHKIRIFPGPPVAAFDTIYPGCEPHTVRFQNTSLHGNSYLWEFDDGTSSTDFEPVHTFEKFGIYNVKLTVTGEGGRDYYYRQVEVYRKPIVDFSVAPVLVMLPDAEIQLYNLSEHGNSYLWNFGDSNTSTDLNPGHLYTEVGVYDISLDVWTEHGCTDRLVKPKVVTVDATGSIKFPNAFFPDMGGSNGGYYYLNQPEKDNVFHPIWEGVDVYHLQIFNRWGVLIYTSDDVMIGWDGYYQGKLAMQGVYVYKCTGTFVDGRPFELVGDVTLLRSQ